METLAAVDSLSLALDPMYELARCCSELKCRLRREKELSAYSLMKFGEYRALVWKNMLDLHVLYLDASLVPPLRSGNDDEAIDV